MTFSQWELNELAAIAHELAYPDARPIPERIELSKRLLTLFEADFIGQTRWNDERGLFEKPVCYNRDESMSVAYENYYQFCDPISERIRGRTRPTATYDVIDRDELEQSEYFNDFLKPFEVTHGLDLYLYDDARHIGELRIWRESSSDIFNKRHKEILTALQPFLKNTYLFMMDEDFFGAMANDEKAMTVLVSADRSKTEYSPALVQWITESPHVTELEIKNAFTKMIDERQTEATFSNFRMKLGWRNVAPLSKYSVVCSIQPFAHVKFSDELTPREREVALWISRGLTDREIGDELGISYWTVRTHVGSILQKLDVRNRTMITRRLINLGL